MSAREYTESFEKSGCSRATFAKAKDGFSLIELIIAVAILAIFVGTVSLSFALLRSTDTKGLANGINDSLTDLKAMTEAHQGPFYLHIFKTADGFYSRFDNQPTITVPGTAADGDHLIGPATLDVTFSVDGVVSNEQKIDGSKYATVQIQKKDGAYQDVTDTSGTVVSQVPKYFVVLDGTDRDYQVVLAKFTGLHYVEQLD